MNRSQLLKLIGVFILAAAFIVGCNKDEVPVTPDALQLTTGGDKVITYQGSQVIPGQYIVVLKKDEITDRALSESTYEERKGKMREAAVIILQALRIETGKIGFAYGTALKGFSVNNFTDDEAKALAAHPQVEYIEQDQTISVTMGGPPGGGGGGGAQTTPPGITRVGGGLSGAGKRAWIIDTGIDLNHPDLNVNTSLSATFLGGNSTPDDQNGHGSHVAGTVAAIDNTEGVIGVAAGAEVVAVRVLDRRGSGSTSGVIAGVDYVKANASSQDAANMSLGGGVSTSLDNAVISASASCPFALAAGNESDNANNHSPARANGPNIYTVSAMNSSDNWASFSNYGNPPVDFCAPGVSILSTWKDGGYNTISGTSMATPHVCGLLLLGTIHTDGTVNGDPDGNPDPIAHH